MTLRKFAFRIRQTCKQLYNQYVELVKMRIGIHVVFALIAIRKNNPRFHAAIVIERPEQTTLTAGSNVLFLAGCAGLSQPPWKQL